ncbi:MAG: beta-galactosidase [Oceanipulchritudo sp.]
MTKKIVCPKTMSMDDQFHLGASWYPEMWPPEEWPKDIARMREVGFTLIRLFEFAWKRFEPREGEFDFAWAREILDQLHAAGIRAMLGTPTAAPPAWLTSAYPEVLQMHADGTRKTHGKRKHYNHHSSKYRAFARRIAAKMAEELGNHPAVHSWQIDNEMSGFDYGPETREKFHAWLEEKYGDIENLNRTWGLDFWSQAYDRFEQVPLCTASVGSIAVPERHHPSLIMAIARFQNEAWTIFIREQVEEIRKHCHHPITTNMTGFIGQMDWPAHFRVLDRSGTSLYADLSHIHINYSKMDRLRAEKPHPFWMLETAPNWSGGGPVWNIHHDHNGVRAVTWMTMFLGGSMVLYWQWRSHWAGQEMQHGTCVGQTGQWMPGKETWARLASEFKEHGEWLLAHPAQRGPIAIMANCENAWLFSIDPVDPENQYAKRILEDYYMPLKRSHYHRDIIDEQAGLSPYRLLICPHMSILREETREALEEWVREGGRLLLGPLVGTRSVEMTAWTDRTFGGLEDLMGADGAIRFTPHWVEDTIDVEFSDATRCHPKFWCEGFSPREGTEVLATYRGGYGDGHPAVVSRSLGKGRIITVGCPLEETAYLALVRSLAAEAGVHPVVEGSERVLACPRVDTEGKVVAIGLVNTVKERQAIRLPMAGTDLLNGESTGEDIHLNPLEVKIITF